MKRRARAFPLVCLSLLLTMATVLGCSVGDTLLRKLVALAPPRFVYVANLFDNSLSGYSVDAGTGALTSLGAPTPTVKNPVAVIAHPSGKFVYAGGGATGTIETFAVGANGALTPVGTVIAKAMQFQTSMAITGPGDRLYGVGSTSPPSNQIFAYDINQTTGALTPTAGFPITVSGADNLITVTTNANLPVLQALDDGGQIFAFTIGTGGALTQNVHSPYNLGDAAATMGTDPGGVLLFVGLNDLVAPLPTYAIQSDGSLVLVTGLGQGSPCDQPPSQVAVDASGSFLYIECAGPSTQGYIINYATGTLSKIATAPFSIPSQVGFAIAADPSGKFIYITDYSANQVVGASIGSDGSLTQIAAYPTGSAPTAVVVTK